MNTMEQYQLSKFIHHVRKQIEAAKEQARLYGRGVAADFLLAWSRRLNHAAMHNPAFPSELNIADVSNVADYAFTYGLDLRKGKDVDWDAFPIPSIN